MLWNEYPEKLDEMTLKDAYASLQGDPPGEIPFLVWLLENPASPFAMPGSIDLCGHDYFHLLLKQGFSSVNEAFVLGFTMGNDSRTHWIHCLMFKIVSLFLYPPKFRLTQSELDVFDRAFQIGKKSKVKNLNQYFPTEWQDLTLAEVRTYIGINL
jgi:hypothetical protein